MLLIFNSLHPIFLLNILFYCETKPPALRNLQAGGEGAAGLEAEGDGGGEGAGGGGAVDVTAVAQVALVEVVLVGVEQVVDAEANFQVCTVVETEGAGQVHR